MELNIYHIGSPGGRFRIGLGKFLIRHSILNFFKIKFNIHIAGFVLLQNKILYKKLRKINCKIIGYQHGGGYGMMMADREEIPLCDKFVYWSVKNKFSIHRWGLKSKIMFGIKSLFNFNSEPKINLVLPTLFDKESFKFFKNSNSWVIKKMEMEYAMSLVNNNFKNIPKNWHVCWDPRDKPGVQNLETNSSKNSKYIFIGFQPTFIWYCIKFNLEFFIIDDGSFKYVKEISYEGFNKNAIDFINYVEEKIIHPNNFNNILI